MRVDPLGEDPIGVRGGVEDVKFCKGHFGNRNFDQLHTIGNNGGAGRQYWFHPPSAPGRLRRADESESEEGLQLAKGIWQFRV